MCSIAVLVKDYRKVKNVKGRLKRIVAAVLSLLSGAVNALFGGGGGMLLVPAMSYGLKEDERVAHASSIAVVLPLSIFSALVRTLHGTYDIRLGVYVTIGAVFGGGIGALLLKRLPKAALSVLFYGVMIYAGIRFVI